MSTKIQINSLEALERLIGNDNELELEIRSNIVQSFTKKHLKDLVKSEVVESIANSVKSEIHKEFFDIVKDGWNNKTVFKKDVLDKLKDDLKRVAYSELTDLISMAIGEQKTYDAINEKLKTAVDVIENKLTETRLNGTLDTLIRQRIKEQFKL